VLLFPDVEVCRALARLTAEATVDEIIANPIVRDAFRQRLIAAAETGTSTSNRIVRALLLVDPPHPVETTDKGMLASNLVVERRAADIAGLYATVPSAHALLAG